MLFHQYFSIFHWFVYNKLFKCTILLNVSRIKASIKIVLKFTSLTKYSMTVTWSNNAALCNGVMLRISCVLMAVSNCSGCISCIDWTMSILPWAQAKWRGVDLSSCLASTGAPAFRHTRTAYKWSETGLLCFKWTFLCYENYSKIFKNIRFTNSWKMFYR